MIHEEVVDSKLKLSIQMPSCIYTGDSTLDKSQPILGIAGYCLVDESVPFDEQGHYPDHGILVREHNIDAVVNHLFSNGQEDGVQVTMIVAGTDWPELTTT